MIDRRLKLWQMGTLLSTALCAPLFAQTGGSPGFGPASQGEVDSNLPEGIVAQINDVDVMEDAFKDWLMSTKGRYYLHEYLDDLLIRKAANEEGVIVSSDAIEEAFMDSWNRDVRQRFQSNEALYLEELARSGKTFEEHKKEAIEKIESDLLAQELIRSRRNPTDEDLERLFKEEYGENAEKRHVRVAFFDKLAFRYDGGARPTQADHQRLAEDCSHRANQLVEAVNAGGSFVDAVREFSDDNRITASIDPMFNYKEIGGEIENVRRLMFGREVDDAINAMHSPGISEIIDARRGLYVVELIEKRGVALEEAREELFILFMKKPVHAGETFKLKDDLRKAAKIIRRF